MWTTGRREHGMNGVRREHSLLVKLYVGVGICEIIGESLLPGLWVLTLL